MGPWYVDPRHSGRRFAVCGLQSVGGDALRRTSEPPSSKTNRNYVNSLFHESIPHDRNRPSSPNHAVAGPASA